MGLVRILLLKVSIIVILTQIHGKVKYLGGAWNRPFRASNLTVDLYIEDLSWRVGNVTAQNGLKIALNPYTFKLDGTLLGIALKGDVRFENGVVSKVGGIVPSVFASYANRTIDDSQGYINFTIRLTELNTLYDLKTNMEENNADGTVETTMTQIDLSFQVIHTFATKENKVIVNDIEGLSFYSPPSWTIKHRYLQTYAIETLAKRDNDTISWYRKDLEVWQREILAPLIEEQSEGMEFPLSPY